MFDFSSNNTLIKPISYYCQHSEKKLTNFENAFLYFSCLIFNFIISNLKGKYLDYLENFIFFVA